MITVTLYYRQGNFSCERVERLIQEIGVEIPHQLIRLDVDTDPALVSVFGSSVPVVKVGPYAMQGDISAEQLRIAMGAARDRFEQMEKIGDKKFDERYNRARELTRLDRFSGWLSHHYLLLFNLLLTMYLGVAFIPPFLEKAGFEAPAKLIYTLYSPFCHQLAFRSWFLFGEQTFYPRSLAGIDRTIDYETIVNVTSIDSESSMQFLLDARSFDGNEIAGYKVALCERDVALYGGLLLFGLVFSLLKRKIPQIRWYYWLIFGLFPIALDGGSQLLGIFPYLPSWIPLRESTPFLRTLTGGLFGGMTAWYLYPLIEESMRETRAFITSKKGIVEQSQGKK